jgi:hypothetical protein
MRKTADLREDIRVAAAVLRSTERGRQVLLDLHNLLVGELSGIDGNAFDAVFTLISMYRHGFAGSVLKSIAPRYPEGKDDT